MRQVELNLPIDVAWYRARLRALRDEHLRLALADAKKRGQMSLYGNLLRRSHGQTIPT